MLITPPGAVLAARAAASQGQAVIPSGMAWQQHMLVLIMSAKLLADAEAALQMTPDSAGGLFCYDTVVTCYTTFKLQPVCRTAVDA
jgi:hypothetical protein